MSIGYNAFAYSSITGSGYLANLFVEEKNVARVLKEGGSSGWVKSGIHKIQLKNAHMSSFEFCIDVFGDVSCTKVVTGNPSCSFNPNNQRPECSTQWYDDNWGNN
ncbi:hypothetical protein BGZ95_008766 [Linnemannia exigua]|uniref:Uncharacterized protein n=1 Tax=Linnemannia exigua TaxID=604196 RepID=A0AAD4CZG1_9FUNG|nr:hypothetical protein BGZ95_008766 [Linnemannia exigua]